MSIIQWNCRLFGKNIFFKEYLRASASSRYPPEELFRKFLKNSKKDALKEVFF